MPGLLDAADTDSGKTLPLPGCLLKSSTRGKKHSNAVCIRNLDDHECWENPSDIADKRAWHTGMERKGLRDPEEVTGEPRVRVCGQQ